MMMMGMGMSDWELLWRAKCQHSSMWCVYACVEAEATSLLVSRYMDGQYIGRVHAYLSDEISICC